MYNQVECIRLGECIRLLKTYDQGEYFRFARDVLKTPSEDEDERRFQDVFIKTNVSWNWSVQWKLHGIKYLQRRKHFC